MTFVFFLPRQHRPTTLLPKFFTLFVPIPWRGVCCWSRSIDEFSRRLTGGRPAVRPAGVLARAESWVVYWVGGRVEEALYEI